MSLSKPRTIFGVHSVTPYNRSTGLPYGMARVLQGSTLTLEGETVKLMGGSNKFAWASEDGDINASLSFTMSEYPNWLYELFTGATVTQGTAEASGNVASFANKNGTTVVAAAGLVAPTVSTASDLKFGKYVLKATSSTEVKLYALSDADFARGTNGEFLDDDLLIDTWSGVAASGTHVVVGYGLTLNAGGSATALTPGDTAVFDVRPVNTFNRTVKIGGIADSAPEFGCIVMAQKSAGGALFEIDLFKCKSIGFSLGADRKTFAQTEKTVDALYDSEKDGVFTLREVE